MINELITLLKKESPSIWEHTRSIKRGEFLKMNHSKDTKLYYVEDGSFHIFVEKEEKEHTLRLAYRGDLIGALDSFFLEKPSDIAIQAIKKSTVKVVKKDHFMAFIERQRDHLQLWNKILSQLVVEQLEREIDLLTNLPEERYNRVYQRSPHLFQEIPNKYIATYLRMSPETLSRLKKH